MKPNVELLTVAYREIGHALKSKYPRPSGIRLLIDDGEKIFPYHLPEGLWMLIDAHYDDANVPAMYAALGSCVSSAISREQVSALIALATERDALEAAAKHDVPIVLGSLGAMTAGRSSLLVSKLGADGPWLHENEEWPTLREALDAVMSRPLPPPPPTIFWKAPAGGAPVPFGGIVYSWLAGEKPEVLRDPATALAVHAIGRTIPMPAIYALLGLFVYDDVRCSDVETAITVGAKLTISDDGTVETRLEDVVPGRAFIAHASLTRGWLRWCVWDETTPKEKVRCDSLEEVVEGLLAIAYEQEIRRHRIGKKSEP